MYLILLGVAKLASKMIVSVNTPTKSTEDDIMDFGVRRSELNPGSHLTAVGTQLQCHQKPENNAVDPRVCQICSTGWSLQAFLTITSPTFSGLPYRTAVLAIL